MSASSLTYARENEVQIPKSSFLAFRLSYGDIATVAENAKCTLLGKVPDIYLNERNPGIISSIRKIARKTVSKRVKGTISVIHRSVRGGYRYQEGINEDSNANDGRTHRTNSKFAMNVKTELKKLELSQVSSNESFCSEQSVDNENSFYDESEPETDYDERDAVFNIPSTVLRTDTSLTPSDSTPSSYPYPPPEKFNFSDSLSIWDPAHNIARNAAHAVHNTIHTNDDTTNHVPDINIETADNTLHMPDVNAQTADVLPANLQPESTILSQSSELVPEKSTLVSNKVSTGKVTFSADTRSSRSKMTIAMPEPTQIQTEAISREIAVHEKFRRKIRRIAHQSKGRAKEGGNSLQQRLHNAVLRSYKEGEIITTDRMLVLIKEAYKNTNVNNFDELENCDVTVYERWTEYAVVLRKTSDIDAPITIQLYDTKTHSERAKKPTHSIRLNRQINSQFYSPTDKSICVTVPSKRGCFIFILKSRYQTTSFRWLNFVQQSIGIKRDSTFSIKIPDLKVFMEVKIPHNLIYQLMDKRDKINVIITDNGYKIEASRMIEFLRNAILGELRTKENVDYIGEWLKKNPNPWFCFKRYDRLEWIRNDSELFFIQHQLLKSSYQLEFRQMVSEPRTVTKQGISHVEPYPIEGFLSRLNNIAGREMSLFRTFHKMLYFFSSGHILFFTSYYRGVPPTPRSKVASEDELYEELLSVPEIYEKAPYELDENDHLPWLDNESFATYDEIALLEFERRTQQVAKAEGLLDLCHIREIRPVAVEHVQKPHKILQCLLWYSSAELIDQLEIIDAVFEIELVSGRVVKLQAPNRHIRDEWMRRLKELVMYWRTRTEDMLDRKVTVRRKNQQVLRINEYGDSNIVQEWDTIKHSQTEADPYIQNIGGLSMSNPVLMSGVLYQKNKKHSNFNQYLVVLCPGFLVLFSLFTRASTGSWKKASYYRHYLTIPIADCYIYSGFSTSLDLLDRQKEFDSMNPGHHSLPRLYTDGWKSSEEEPLRCFTLWFGKKRSLSGRDQNTEELFKNVKNEMPKNPGLINMIRKLGVTGKSVVFMARSRQERENWVSRIMTEIDRFSS